METHSDTAVAEAPPEEAAPAVEQPDASPEEPASFSDALEQALHNLESPQPEPEPEPAPEVQEVQPKEVTEPTEDPPLADQANQEASANEDSLESLTEDVGVDWTPKAASRFKQLKGELKSSQTELEQLRQMTKEQEAKMQEMSGLVENRDIDKLQQTVADYEYEKAFNNLEDTSAYQTSVAAPLNALLQSANEIASKYNVDADTMVDILAMDDHDEQDNAVLEHLTEAGDRDRARVYRIIEEVRPILAHRQELYENVHQALNEANMLEEQRRNVEAAERAEIRTNVTRNVVQRVNEKLPFLSGVDGLDMNAIQTKAADVDPSVVHPVDFAYNAVAAQLLPTIVREYMSSRKEAEVLMEKLSEYESAEPTMSGAPAADGSTVSSDKSFMDAINNALGGGG